GSRLRHLLKIDAITLYFEGTAGRGKSLVSRHDLLRSLLLRLALLPGLPAYARLYECHVFSMNHNHSLGLGISLPAALELQRNESVCTFELWLSSGGVYCGE